MSNHEKGVIAVLAGPSGVGKDTLIRHITEMSGYRKFVAYTTRPMRVGEVHGRDYFFVTVEAFERLLSAYEFLDHITVDGNHYGTPLQDFITVSRKKERVILHLAAETAILLRSKVQNVKIIFVLPPYPEALNQRLQRRGMSAAAIVNRLANDPTPFNLSPLFDLVVVNKDDAQESVSREILRFLEE